MQKCKNRRGCTEHFVEGHHLKLNDLKEVGLNNRYLSIDNIPDYPQPEFHVSQLKHDTTRFGLIGIRRSGGFKGFCADCLLWWSLAVEPEDVAAAETRLLEKTFPDRTQEQAQMQESFLEKFATSPAFMKTSRLGSYRFTFPVEEVLKAYSDQFCSGAQPFMRVFKTVLYKQEVMHAVLVHSPANQEQFSKFPLLTDDPNAVCAFKDGRFIWRPEAMCETHRYELITSRVKNQMELREAFRSWFYVWDNVALAFHIDSGQVLRFDINRLRENLKFCEPGEPAIAQFDQYLEAEEWVTRLWPYCPDPLLMLH